MVAQALNFGTPADSDEVDGPFYSMGLRWSADAAGSWVGVQWWVPDALTGLQHYAAGFSATEALLASQPITPTPGGLRTFLFGAPVPIEADTVYAAAVLTQHYVYTPSYPLPQTDGHLTGLTFALSETVADTPVWPSNTTGLGFHISPLVDFGSGPPHAIAAASTLGPVSIAATFARSKAIEAAATLGPVAVSAALRRRKAIGVSSVLAGVTIAAAFNGEAAVTVVARPHTGSVTRPNTGTVTVPRLTQS